MKQSKYPTYNAAKDGNVFAWILAASKDVREKRHKEDLERLEANGRREQSKEGQR